MNVPVGCWICLGVGLILGMLTGHLNSRPLRVVGRLALMLGLALPWCRGIETHEFHVGGWLAAAAWWLGFGWTGTGRLASPAAQLRQTGDHGLTLAGLLLCATAHDWLTLLLAIEIVRLATRSAPATQAPRDEVSWRDWQHLCPLLSGLCLLCWTAATGAISFEEVAQVLNSESYLADLSHGLRPPLIPTAAALLTMFAVCGPLLWQASTGPLHGNDDAVATSVAHTTARQLAALLALQRAFTVTGPVVERSWLVGCLIVTGMAWCLACLTWFDRQRFDRAFSGLALFVWGSLVMWQGVALGQHHGALPVGKFVASLSLSYGAPAAVIHWIAMLAGATAGLRLLVSERSGCWYWDQFRGLGQQFPIRSLLVLVPLCSLIGVPGSSGFWLRGMWLLGLTGMQRVSGEEGVAPQEGFWLAAVVGVLGIAVAARAILQLTRLLWLEPMWGIDRTPKLLWPAVVAWGATLATLAVGCCPQLLIFQQILPQSLTAVHDKPPDPDRAHHTQPLFQ